MAPWPPSLLRRNQGDLSGGLTGALLSVPNAIGNGIIIFAPLGASAAGLGTVSALLAGIVGGMVSALLGSSRGMASGSASSLALLLAGVVILSTQGLTGPEAIGAALAAVMSCTMLAGLFLAGLAWMGAGGIAPLMPYSVLAGIVNGTAILMAMSLAPHALGLSTGWGSGDWDPFAVLVAATALVLTLAPLPRWLRGVPSVLLAVLVATALHHLLLAFGAAEDLGPLLGAMPPLGPWLDVWWRGLNGIPHQDPWRLLLTVVPVAASMALLAMLETLSTISALQDASGNPADARRDLMAVALGNVLAGVAGGMATAGSMGTSMAMAQAGSTRGLGPALRSLLLLAAWLLLGQQIGQIPMAALAGVVIAGAWRLVDLEGLRPVRRATRAGARHRSDVIGSALVILVVAGIAVKWSLLTAVAVGLLLALAVFATAMSRQVVRRSYSNPIGRSRIRRPDAETRVLLAEGKRIAVLEIEGAIFFGSAEQVGREVRRLTEAGAEYIILDMRRVSRIDHSGARRLVRTCAQFWRGGLHLSLAYVRPGLAVWDYLEDLDLLAGLRRQSVFASLDAAIEDAEVALLAAHGGGTEVVLTPAEGLAALGIPPETVAMLLPLMQPVTLAKDEVVIRAGESARSVWLLLSGQLDVTLPLATSRGTSGLRTRLATLMAGALVGEMALLSGTPRSADVVARTRAECLRFEVETMTRLRQEAPDAAYQLLAGISLQVQQNLRLANMSISGLEE